MAKFTLTIATSDDLTADNALYWKIYDTQGTETLHATTGTALADANVVLTGSEIVVSNVSATQGQQYLFEVASVDADGNEKRFTNAVSYLDPIPSGAKPVLSNFTIEDGQPSRIYFDSSKVITASNTTGFFLGDGLGTTITGVTIATGLLTGHYFTKSSTSDFFDNYTIRYEGGSNFIDTSSGAVQPFTLTYSFNNIVEPTSSGTDYFVNLSGNDTNDGLTVGTAWRTLTYAVRDGSIVSNGDRIFVLAGNYGAEIVRCYVYSTDSTNPIKIIGYKTNPTETDISTNYYSTLGAVLDSTEMPLFDGGDQTAGEGFWFKEGSSSVNRGSVIVKNLQFQNYLKGVTIRYWMNSILFERILVKDIGDSTTGTTGRGFNQSSEGFNGSTKLRFKDITAMNCSEMNFGFSGNHILAENIKSYNDRTLGAGDSDLVTDYYCLVNGSNNIIRNSLLDKHCSTGFGGHGYSWKASTYDTEYNLTELSTAINIAGAFNSRHGQSQNNVFKNNESHANVAYVQTVDDRPSGFAATNGASYNIYENNYVHHTTTAFNTSGGIEDDAAAGGTGNIFRNNLIHDVLDHAISFSNSSGSTTKLNSDNKFYNNTFYNVVNLFSFSTAGNGLTYSGNEFKNNLISNVTNFYDTSGLTEAYSAQITIDYNNFFGGFAVQGTNATSIDEDFTDLVDFVPQGALKIGVAIAGVEYDKNNVERADPPTIGILEI